MTQSMSAKNGSTEDGTDIGDLPPDATRFGVDGEGATHYYSSDEDAIFVLEDDGVERHDLVGSPIVDPYDWARHVYTDRGEWEELDADIYAPSEMEPLAEAVAEKYNCDVDVQIAALARRVYDRVQEDGAGVEAAIAAEIEAVDEPVDSEEVRQAYAKRYGGGE